MKRIQLSDGMPTTVERSVLKEGTRKLLDAVLEVCETSGLSYVEINKALHIADEELYREVIEREF